MPDSSAAANPAIESESILIDAPAATIFDILADPAQHARIDGSTMVKSVVSGPQRLSLGAKFAMNMQAGGKLPYKITNRVVEFEVNRRIAWRHIGPHRWRYELSPQGPDQTLVTESFDYTYCGLVRRNIYRAAGFPKANLSSIGKTLVLLKAAAEHDAQL